MVLLVLAYLLYLFLGATIFSAIEHPIERSVALLIASYSEYQHQSMFCIYYYSQGDAEGAGEPEV